MEGEPAEVEGAEPRLGGVVNADDGYGSRRGHPLVIARGLACGGGA